MRGVLVVPSRCAVMSGVVPCVLCGTAIEADDSPARHGESICNDCFDHYLSHRDVTVFLNRTEDDIDSELLSRAEQEAQDEVDAWLNKPYEPDVIQMAFFSLWDDR